MSNLMISAHLHNLPTTPLEPQPQVPTHLKMHLNDPQGIVQPTAAPFELNSVFQLKHISDSGGSYLQGESCFQAEPYYVVRIAPHVTCAIMITYHTLEVQLLFVLRWTTKITKVTLSCYYKKGCTNRAMKRALKIFLEFLPVGIIMRKEIIVVMEKVFAVQIHFNKLLYGVAFYCVQFLFSCENIV